MSNQDMLDTNTNTNTLVDDYTAEQIERYKNWLQAEAEIKQSRGGTQHATMASYARQSMHTVNFKGQNVRVFAPFRRHLSALQTITPAQKVILGMIAMALTAGLAFWGMNLLVAAIALISIFYIGDLFFTFLISLRTVAEGFEDQTVSDEVVQALVGQEWPSYTILCPLYKEARVVPTFVRGIQALDYPQDKLQVLFLTEEDDAETRNAILAMQLPAHFQVLTVPDGSPRTKPRACNYGLLHTTGDYVVIYDAEDIPEPLQLKKAILTFAKQGPDTACVQAKLNFYNPEQNLLTRWFTAEYSLWFDLTLPALQRAKLPLPLGGTSNHFRTEALRALGAWDAFNVTEDCDLGLRLARYNMKTAMLDSTTYEEATSRPKNWLKQRSRWIKGYMQTYLVYMRHPLRYLRPGHMREFLSLQLIVGGKAAVLLINPLMWAMLAIYIALRPLVGEAYHTLFPAPIFYMGVTCLVFGNFFYVYSTLAGNLKRSNFKLVKWMALVPVYWLMMSAAAYIALYELITKPHHWHKTQHGMHTAEATTTTKAAWISEALEEAQHAVQQSEHADLVHSQATTLASSLQATLSQLEIDDTMGEEPAEPQMPVFTSHKAVEKKPTASVLLKPLLALRKDRWLLVTLLTAIIASISALIHYVQAHQTVIYGDAFSHLVIARRLFDNLTPGLAQLGGVWLPLPHLLMVPFVWNNLLWETGLAGSIPSMICFIIAATYLFLSIRRLTRNNLASYAGTLLFVLNPNILYLQTTPLSELVLIATMTMTSYHFLAWVQENSYGQLITAAFAAFLASLSRYDGWILFIACFALVGIIGLFRRQRWSQIEANLVTFGSLGSFGIALWFLWCEVIFGDPLFFQRGPFSAQAQQKDLIRGHLLYTNHDLWQAIRYYAIDVAQILGPITIALAVLGMIVLLLRRTLRMETLAILAFLAPMAFYVVSLYGGQAALFVPGAVPVHSPNQLFNARYGAITVVPAALFFGILIAGLVNWSQASLGTHKIGHRVASTLMIGTLMSLLLIQVVTTMRGGITTLQEGLYGFDCANEFKTVNYLVQHYAGGNIMADLYTSQIDQLEPKAGINFKNVVYEGSGTTWYQALHNPEANVNWIIVNLANHNDLVARNINMADFHAHFTQVTSDSNGLSLYHRNSAPQVAIRTSPGESFLGNNNACHPLR